MKIDKPVPIDDVTLAFPASVKHLMPTPSDIPEDYPGKNYWTWWQREWFYRGLNTEGSQAKMPIAKESIDRQLALRHLATIQRSYEPKHEHKEAAVAWLASLWFVLPESESV